VVDQEKNRTTRSTVKEVERVHSLHIFLSCRCSKAIHCYQECYLHFFSPVEEKKKPFLQPNLGVEAALQPPNCILTQRKVMHQDTIRKIQVCEIQSSSITTPFMVLKADCASSAVSNETNPKPRDLPDSLS
jgi:hypothetical protein